MSTEEMMSVVEHSFYDAAVILISTLIYPNRE